MGNIAWLPIDYCRTIGNQGRDKVLVGTTGDPNVYVAIMVDGQWVGEGWEPIPNQTPTHFAEINPPA
jgi:hypothetical protein